MVYLRAITPALCELMDAAARDAPEPPAITATHRAFAEHRLRSLVHTQVPSQLDNALWIYLISQEQLLLRQVKSTEAETATAAVAAAAPTLPSSLQLPPSIATVQDAVRWYCEELSVAEHLSHAKETQEAAPAVAKSTPSSISAASPPHTVPRRGMLFSDTPLKRHGAAQQSGARLDELLRHRHQPSPAAANTTTTSITTNTSGSRKENGESEQKPLPTGPLATVRLALAALFNSKRAAALRQPRSLVLVVRDVASLWAVVYLCRQLRHHQIRKEQVLKGNENNDAVLPSNASGKKAAHARIPATEPIAVCFHDYDLLLPWDLVYATLAAGAVATASQAPVTMASVAARCRDGDRRTQERDGLSGGCTLVCASTPSPISLVINPAVTVIEDNPDRLRKNARIDAIDEAANKYYYTLLATGAHGQAGGASSMSGNAAAAAASSSSTAAASAAAHQEALRNSLATIDLGDYGVLDPSRMRAPVPLKSAASTGASATLGAASGQSAERTAKSYSLFLRDASIGFDIQIMALTGAGVGYYMGYLRGLSTEWCTLYAVVGLVTMMLVDAVLIMIRMGRQDEAVLRARKRIRRQREKLEKEGEKLVQAMQHAAAGVDGAPTANDDSVRGTTHCAVDAASQVEVDAFTKKRQ